MSKFAIRLLTLAISATALVPTVMPARTATYSKQIKKLRSSLVTPAIPGLPVRHGPGLPIRQARFAPVASPEVSSVKFGLLQLMMILIEECQAVMAASDVRKLTKEAGDLSCPDC